MLRAIVGVTPSNKSSAGRSGRCPKTASHAGRHDIAAMNSAGRHLPDNDCYPRAPTSGFTGQPGGLSTGYLLPAHQQRRADSASKGAFAALGAVLPTEGVAFAGRPSNCWPSPPWLIAHIALMSGYASVQRFNAAFVEPQQLNPTQRRRKGTRAGDTRVVGRTEQGSTSVLDHRARVAPTKRRHGDTGVFQQASGLRE